MIALNFNDNSIECEMLNLGLFDSIKFKYSYCRNFCQNLWKIRIWKNINIVTILSWNPCTNMHRYQIQIFVGIGRGKCEEMIAHVSLPIMINNFLIVILNIFFERLRSKLHSHCNHWFHRWDLFSLTISILCFTILIRGWLGGNERSSISKARS